jgi:hypothetical protein
MAKITIDTDYLTGYRTLGASVLTCIFGLLAQTDWVSFLNNPKAGAIAIGMSILMAILRLITHTPPGKSIQTLEAEKKSKKENEEKKNIENAENPEINIDKTPEA